MSKGGQSQPKDQTITQNSIPKEFYPFYERILGRGEAISNRPYEAYGGQRLAGLSADTNASMDMARNLGSTYTGYMDQGRSALTTALGGAQAAGAYQPTQVTTNPLTTFQQGPVANVNAGQWSGAAANQYMNPYINNVLGNQVRQAEENYQRQTIGRNDQAIKTGMFGGSRRAVADSMARRDWNNQVNDMVGQGFANAYDSGMSAFGADRNARLQADLANQQTQTGIGERNLQAQLGVQQLGAQQNLQAQELNNQFGLQGAQLGLQGAELGSQIGAQFGDMGNMMHTLSQQDMDALRNAGLTQEQQQQAGLDIGYDDFVNQRDYERNNLNFMSGILNGINVPVNSNTVTRENVNPFAQLLGAGVGITGLTRALGSGGTGGGT